jgi:hypothetical protein
MKKRISKRKVDAIVRSGGTVAITKTASKAAPVKKTAPAKAEPQPVSDKLFSTKEIKEIMIEAMKIATRNERRGTSRLIVKRDSRGFIDTVDIVPVEEPVTLQ